ncbi:hypothetical protein [Microbulbifer sp. GL-2]|uniref:hypothetical protein n=1 Tax=Microbulbifer sp. GL-2 TaxID=2591606 RepID=UPI001165BD22|nr:hypothetical protein [Microbulbifer sp. GL-2]BBM04044.1 hypothetical protein GL2_41180 [Microbulbifer sp. GL-2]
MAREVRAAFDCDFCGERKKALSPYQVEGRHYSNSNLPEAIFDALHRIVTDPSRLSEVWFKQLVFTGFPVGKYVTLVAVTVFVLNVVTFHRALGLPLEELPSMESMGTDSWVIGRSIQRNFAAFARCGEIDFGEVYA